MFILAPVKMLILGSNIGNYWSCLIWIYSICNKNAKSFCQGCRSQLTTLRRFDSTSTLNNASRSCQPSTIILHPQQFCLINSCPLPANNSFSLGNCEIPYEYLLVFMSHLTMRFAIFLYSHKEKCSFFGHT